MPSLTTYKLLKQEHNARRGEFKTVHGTVQTPAFQNVATAGAIKGGLSAHDLKDIGAQVMLCNTYHLHLRPGDKLVAEMGGLHKFTRWNGPILTDSGGFQVFSLAKLRKITEEGVTFASHLDGHRIFMGPEESMRIQSNLGSDIAELLGKKNLAKGVRVQMEETPIFRMAQEQKKVVKSPLTEVFKKSWKEVIQATFLVAVTYTLFYTLATWSLAWGTKTVEQGGGNLGFSNQEYLLMLMIAVCVFAAFIVISCVNADKFGRKRVIIISSCCLIAFALLFPFLLDPAVVGQRNFATNLLFLCIGFALMGTAFGPIGAFLPELFDANVRYSGSGIGYNLAAIVGAAFVPTIATWLSHHWGVHSVGLYLGVMALCCLIAVLSCKETKNVDFTK